jgi:hypothetical protein
MTKLFVVSYCGNEQVLIDILHSDSKLSNQDKDIINFAKKTLVKISKERVDLLGEPIVVHISHLEEGANAYEIQLSSEEVNKIYEKIREKNFR